MLIKFKNKPIFQSFCISSEYGYRIHPITKKKQFHKGVDIVSESSDYVSIYSVDDGFIIYQGWNKLRGNYVVVQHKNYATLYQHLYHYVTKQNMVIKAGEFIGSMGSSGQSTGRHLHFEVYIGQYSKRNIINPKILLKGEAIWI